MPSPKEPRKLSVKQLQAAMLVAEDKIYDSEIAKEVGVSKRTIETWKTWPEFQKAVTNFTNQVTARIRRRGIAVVERRVERLQTDWDRMQYIITARAKRFHATRKAQLAAGGDDYDAELVPEEAETGLVILVETKSKFGVERKWVVDTALLAELRNHEQQAAKELGQWKDKTETTGEVLIREYPAGV
jgi:hypothetical protein